MNKFLLLVFTIFSLTACGGGAISSTSSSFNVSSSSLSSSSITSSVSSASSSSDQGVVSYINLVPSSLKMLSDGSQSVMLDAYVLNESGHLMQGVTVTFTADSGGLKGAIDAGTQSDLYGLITTDIYGKARTFLITAGDSSLRTIHVTASVGAGSSKITTNQSIQVVSASLPDQDSFALSLDAGLNIEAYDVDGIKNTITARLSGHDNNPVADGTVVVFQAEGGSIQSECKTLAGKCSVTWTSSNPHPADGRATIMATAIGEESFNDVNGNGVFDTGDTFTDIAEPFRDDNEDGIHQADEPFYDFNSNGTWDVADSVFNGVCETGTCSATRKTAGISASRVLIMSGSRANITLSESPIDLTDGLVHTVNVDVFDDRNQVMPAGTKVEFSITNGKLLSASSFTVGSVNTSTGQLITATTRFPIMVYQNEPADSTIIGSLTVTVTTPGGEVTTKSVVVLD